MFGQDVAKKNHREIPSSLMWGGIAFFLVSIATGLGLYLRPDATNMFWPAAGTATGLMVAGRLHRVGVAVGSLLGLVCGVAGYGLSAATGMLLVAGSLFEAAAIATLFVRFAGTPPALGRLSDLVLFLVLSMVTVAATGFCVALTFGLVDPGAGTIVEAWREWSAAHLIGVWTIAPAILRLPSGRRVLREGFAAEDLTLAAAVSVASIVLIGALLPTSSLAMLFVAMLLAPLTWWVALRASPWRAAVALLIVALVTMFLTAHSTGLFAGGIFPAQMFLGAIAVALLTIGALRGEDATRPQSETDRPLDPFRDLGTLTVLMPLILFAAAAWWSWRGVEADGEARVRRMVGTLSEHVQRILEVQDGLLQAALARVRPLSMAEIGGSEELHRFLLALQRSTNSSHGIALIRADTGQMIALSNQFPLPNVNLSSRDYVRRHLEGKTERVIGSVIRTEPSGDVDFTISRYDPAKGLIAVSRLPLDTFHDFFVTSRESPSDVFTLARRDGAILARQPILGDGVGAQLRPNAYLFRYIRGELTKPTSWRSSIDGTARLAHVQPVGGFPLYVFYGLDFGFLRGAWLRVLVPFGILALLSAAGLRLLTRRMERSGRDAEEARLSARMEAERAEASRRSEAMMRESHRAASHLAAIVASSFDAIVSTTLDGRLTSWNRSAERMFGRTEKEMIGKSVREIIPPDRQDEEDRIVGSIAMGDIIEDYETERIHKDGTRIDVAVTASPVRDPSGTVVGVSKIFHDIRQRKQVEAALRESEAYNRNVLEASPDCVKVLDSRGHLEYMNKNGLCLMEIDDFATCSGQEWSSLWPSEAAADVRQAMEAAQAGVETRFEAFCPTAKGTPRWWDVCVTPVLDGHGQLQRIVAVSRDVSERKDAEARIAASEARFRGIYEYAGTAIAISDLEGTFQDCNPAYATLIGYGPDELAGADFRQFLHRDDIHDNMAEIGRLLAGETTSFEIVNRLIRKDGAIIWVHKHVSLLRDGQGEPTHILALLTDMSESKHAEERQLLLMRELAHRGKNLLAVVQSIAARTLSGRQTLDQAREAFTGRLQALARTYGSLTDEAFEGAPLRAIIAGEISSFVARVSISGPDIMLTAKAAQTFSLLIHELATNAIKYGSLSIESGIVEICWTIEDCDDGKRFRFQWIERHGPPAEAPTRNGFGTTLITHVAAAEFDCRPRLDYKADGFVYTLDAALATIGAAISPSPLRQRLKSERLKSIYDAWTAACDAESGLPRIDAFAGSQLPGIYAHTIVEVNQEGNVRMVEVARPVAERVGRAPSDAELLSHGHQALTESYRRSAIEQKPQYESLRFDFGDGQPVSFERLLLPFSTDVEDKVRVVGIVVISRENDGRAQLASAAGPSANPGHGAKGTQV